jgi:hypothetical protein
MQTCKEIKAPSKPSARKYSLKCWVSKQSLGHSIFHEIMSSKSSDIILSLPYIQQRTLLQVFGFWFLLLSSFIFISTHAQQSWLEKATVNRFNFPQCVENRTWSQLASTYSLDTFISGGLGALSSGTFKVWACFAFHPCLSLVPHAQGDMMCYVFDEEKAHWYPWCLNSERAVCSASRQAMCNYHGSIYARYTSSSFSKAEKKWYDTSGNDRHTIFSSGEFDVQNITGKGMSRTVTAVHGNTDSRLLFPEKSIPEIFTICSLSRYADEGPHQRILSGMNANWLHGHWANNAGMVFYGPAERTAVARNMVEPNTNWVLLCGQNSGDNHILLDGKQVGKEEGHIIVGGDYLQINHNDYYGLVSWYGRHELSSWYVSEIAIWDFALSLEDMQRVTQYFREGGWDKVDPAYC